jgi:hypothetical protein
VPREFERWRPFHPGSSWALRLFIAHHTELNALYWAHEPASRFIARAMKNQLNANASQALAFSGIDQRRIEPTVDVWLEAYDRFNNWTRVSALVALSSYFEVYLKTIISLALESDPGAPRGASRRVDGVVMLKYGTHHSYFEDAKQVVIGDWSKRLKSYRELFGVVPSELQALQGDLERLRQLRNDAGHKFGRNMHEEDYRSRVEPIKMVQVGLPTLKKHLGVVESATRAIDAHLLGQHIGSYEMVYFYHTKHGELFEPGRHARKLRKALGAIFGIGFSDRFCEALKAYYENL